MTDALARRGPDSQGVHTWEHTALGHRRLAILDLSDAGRQPMLSEDGQIGLVFNGCIYNFRELRGELEQLGHRFFSRCDTEVILRGYREWGIDALVTRMRGMFAIALWDEPRRTLTLVRDRLGVKPLVYCSAGGEIAFASTVTSLRVGGFGGEVDPQAVLDLLEYGYVTEDHCIFEGIGKVPPATILEWCEGQVSQRRYWSPPEMSEPARVSFDEAVEETERLLVDAVQMRLVADVPVSALLSGGVDSSLICWALSKLEADVKAFTVRAPGDRSDESQEAAATARRLGIDHEIVDMPDTDFSLDELVDAYGEPFPCQSAQAMLWVSRAVSRRAKVLLTGDGGDDIFLGYPYFFNAWRAERLARSLPAALPGLWHATRGLVPGIGPARRLKNFLNYATGGLGDYLRAHDGIPFYESRGMLGARLDGRSLPQRQVPSSFDSARRLLSDVVAHHWRHEFSCEYMTKVDGATMHYTIEARAPLLDQRIWEFAAELPPEIRFRGGQLKAVLREIARRRIGPEVAFREKKGFTVPVERWLADRWSGMLDRFRGETRLERDGWLKRGTLQRTVAEAIGRGWVPVHLWRLLVLEHWLAVKSKPVTPPQRLEDLFS